MTNFVGAETLICRATPCNRHQNFIIKCIQETGTYRINVQCILFGYFCVIFFRHSGVIESDLCSVLPCFSYVIMSVWIYVLLYSWLCYHVNGLRNVMNIAFASRPICHAMGLVDSGKLILLIASLALNV